MASNGRAWCARSGTARPSGPPGAPTTSPTTASPAWTISPTDCAPPVRPSRCSSSATRGCSRRTTAPGRRSTGMTGTVTAADVRAAFARRDILSPALSAAAPELAAACHAMAGRFARGGRLLAFGEGLAAADAAHVVVEFAHPVIVGKRALPAAQLGDPATLRLFARPGDVALGIGDGPSVAAGLAAAVAAGLLTVALVGGDSAVPAGVAHVLAVASDDPQVVREGFVTAYHVLWELVHVF